MIDNPTVAVFGDSAISARKRRQRFTARERAGREHI